MAQTKGPSLAAPAQVVPSTQAPKLRRKLQKALTKQRSSGARRLGASDEALRDNKCDTANRRPPAQAQSCLPPVPPLHGSDPSDSKWSEFFRGNGCLHYQDSASKSSNSLASPVNIIPEFYHLAVRDVQHRQQQQQQKPRTSSDSRKSTATMRRRAKTPIFSIGQLDTIPRPGNALAKTSSVELIAEQYRALLESRASVYSDSHSEPPPSRHGQETTDSLRRQQSSDELNIATPIYAPNHTLQQQQPPLQLGSSPISDDGTLVSFEEETVYFKPVSFSPEPLSPPSHFDFEDHRRFPSPLPPAPDNLSLQICLDLLTRDLSSALANRPGRNSSETSALQVWVMIEAYERLRDQLADRGSEGLETMLDMWLRALYTVHDSLTGRSDSGSEYESMGVEDLD
ncbi:hypothetical protein B0T16DRAFT_209162 [Cercophora newfieldiana]|uniref:Mating-type switching protein swi10 n=1 Tax=Cercophora newfieldiana TaxID=92897 RepID=A0AA39XWJ2_9PEZI|nr:hypothetical protein B0T16DRAFT_209162 [Cercophora newfieldiana]